MMLEPWVRAYANEFCCILVLLFPW